MLNKHPKRRIKAKLRQDRQEASGPNDAPSKDLVHDPFAVGSTLRFLTVVDRHSPFCMAADPCFGCRVESVAQTFERVCGRIGYPRTIGIDNDSEFLLREPDLWAYDNDVTTNFSRPRKPPDNGFIEAFNSTLGAGCPTVPA